MFNSKSYGCTRIVWLETRSWIPADLNTCPGPFTWTPPAHHSCIPTLDFAMGQDPRYKLATLLVLQRYRDLKSPVVPQQGTAPMILDELRWEVLPPLQNPHVQQTPHFTQIQEDFLSSGWRDLMNHHPRSCFLQNWRIHRKSYWIPPSWFRNYDTLVGCGK